MAELSMSIKHSSEYKQPLVSSLVRLNIKNKYNDPQKVHDRF